MDHRAELFEIVRKESVFRGHFRLASGRESDVYFDGKLTTLGQPRGLELVCQLFLEEIRALAAGGVRVDAIGGLTIGAAPIVAGVALLALREGMTIPGFVVRKEPKAHGRNRLIEGDVKPGTSVVVIDDVVTTGASVLKAIDAARQAGARVVKVLALVDRDEGGREALAEYDYTYLFPLKDFLANEV